MFGFFAAFFGNSSRHTFRDFYFVARHGHCLGRSSRPERVGVGDQQGHRLGVLLDAVPGHQFGQLLAGADILVAGSAVFGAADPAAAVRRLAAL